MLRSRLGMLGDNTYPFILLASLAGSYAQSCQTMARKSVEAQGQIGFVSQDLIGSFGWLPGGDWWRTVSEEVRRVAAESPRPDLLTAPATGSYSLYGHSALDALYADKSKAIDRCMEDVDVEWMLRKDLRLHSIFFSKKDEWLLRYELY